MTTARLSGPTTAAGHLARRFVAWWLGELAELVPSRLSWLVGKADHAAAVLEVASDDTALVLPQRGASHPTRVPLHGCDEQTMRSRIQSVMRGGGAGHAVTIRLDPSMILQTSVTLPVTAETSLQAILQHQLERLVPLPAREVCFEYRVGPRIVGAKELTVHVAIATRASVDHALALARAGGLSPRRVIAPIDSPAPEPTVVLWRVGRERTETPLRRRLRHGLEVVAVLLLLSAYALYVHRLDTVRDQLRREVDAAVTMTASARDLARQLGQTTEALALLQRRWQETTPLRLLDELTDLIPESSWVTQLIMRNRTVEIIGYSPRATDLISRLESSSLLANPQFRAPITLTPDGKGERFDLSFEIRPVGAQ